MQPFTGGLAAPRQLLEDIAHSGTKDIPLHDATIEYENDIPIGALVIEKTTGEWRLWSVRVEPGFHRMGLACDLVAAVQDEARRANVVVSVIVGRRSPAVQLLRKHGFDVAAETDAEALLKWRRPLALRVS
ncbi:GNAT family N-acetyltransferase [Paraburkholderia sp. SIMBA_049]